MNGRWSRHFANLIIGSVVVSLAATTGATIGGRVSEEVMLSAAAVGSAAGVYWVLKHRHEARDFPANLSHPEVASRDQGAGLLVVDLLPELDLETRLEQASSEWWELRGRGAQSSRS